MNKKITAALLSAIMAVQLAAGANAAKAPDGFLPNGWNITNTDAKASFNVDMDCKKSGNASLLVKTEKSESGSVKIVQEIFGLEPSCEYIFSFSAKTSNAKYFKIIRDVIYSVDARNENNETSDWYSREITFKTGKNKTSASFQFMIKDGDNTSVWIDDCSLIKNGEEKNLVTNPGFEDGIDADAPAAVTGFTAEEDDRVCLLKWTDSVSEDAEKVILYCDGTEMARVGKGVGRYLVENLENGREYSFKAVVIDGWENLSDSAEIKAVPIAQREAPNVYADDESNLIVGIDDTMEYRIDDGEWVSYTQAPDLSGTHIVDVRYKKTENEKEGKITTLIFYKNKTKTETDLSAYLNVGLDGISFGGKAGTSSVTALVLPQSGENSQLVYAMELEPEQGNFKADFAMPSFAQRGKYVLRLNADGKMLSMPFSYVSSEDVDLFAASLNGKSVSEIKQLIADDGNKDIIESLGIDIDDYNSAFNYDNAARLLAEKSGKLDKNVLNEILGGQMLLSMLNKAKTAVEVLTALDKYSKFTDLTFEDKAWNDVDDNSVKSNICTKLAGVLFNNLADVQSKYKLVNIYYRINNESYASLGEIMTKYASELELYGKDGYTRYQNADKAKKTEIQKKIKLAKSEYNDNQSLLQALTSAVGSTSGSSTGSGGGSSGGSSGGTSGSGRATTGSVAAAVSDSYVTEDKSEDIFTDLTSAEWAKTAIEALYKMGVVFGISEKEFCPMDTVTREQTAKMLVDAFDLTLSEIPPSFIDVEESRWSYPYVMIMRDNKIISGYEDGTFRPNQSITREEMAFILVSICERNGITLAETRNADSISDLNDAADFAREALKKLYCAEILNGTSQTEISPKGTATRAMAAQLIYNLIKEAGTK